MAHPFYPSGTPRLNHVAMSLAADRLDETHREAICRFCGDVFGFEELAVMTEDRRRLVLSCVHWDQFLFLIADDEPMRCPAWTTSASRSARSTSCSGPATGRRPSAGTTTGSTSSTYTSTTRGWSRSTRSTSGTCCR